MFVQIKRDDQWVAPFLIGVMYEFFQRKILIESIQNNLVVLNVVKIVSIMMGSITKLIILW